VALAAAIAGAGLSRPLIGGESQKKTKAEREAALKEQKAREAAEKELITRLRTVVNAAQWKQAEELYKQLVEMEPAVWIYQVKLGDVQFALEKYEAALGTYEKALRLARAQLNTTTPNPYPPNTTFYINEVLVDEGNIYAKHKKSELAISSYKKAAELGPLTAEGYFNLCAMQFNMKIVEGTLAACESAIVGDPKHADAYYIKGSLLMAGSRKDSSGQIVPAPGAVEALSRYLLLEPRGAHAAEVKAMLESAGLKQ
jgi:tetratricopeptide (TPR) repeat protein